jgi:hypothetical protein
MFMGFVNGELIVKGAKTREEAQGLMSLEIKRGDRCRIEQIAVGGGMGAPVRIWNYDTEIKQWVESN